MHSKHLKREVIMLTGTIMLAVFFGIFANTAHAEQTKSVPGFLTRFIGNATLGKQYFTSFESNSEFKDFYVVPNNYLNTSTNFLTSEKKVTGLSSHKAYMYGSNPIIIGANTNHRGYPVFNFLQTSIGVLQKSVLIEFYVWSDIKIPNNGNIYSDWISLASFTSYDDIYWPRTYLINLDNKNQLYLMHVPEQNQSVHDIYQAVNHPMPLQSWVKISTYIDFTANNNFNSPYMALWQNGVLVSAARFNPRIDMQTYLNLPNQPTCITDLPANATPADAEASCGYAYVGGLAQAHFGLYAPPLLSSGRIYNDDLTVSEILH